MSDCEYCLIAQGKVYARKVFENDMCYAILSPLPAAPGHVILFPKAHAPILEQLKDFEVAHLFTVANKLSTAAFESIGAQGTNIIVQNGVGGGQKVAHFSMHIIPRRENDGLNLIWQPKQLTEEQMSTVELQLKDATNSIGEFEKEKKEPVNLDKPKELKEIKGENYLIRQLRRIP
jgi:histidine triad (HIT) family protein